MHIDERHLVDDIYFIQYFKGHVGHYPLGVP